MTDKIFVNTEKAIDEFYRILDYYMEETKSVLSEDDMKVILQSYFEETYELLKKADIYIETKRTLKCRMLDEVKVLNQLGHCTINKQA